MAHLLKVCFAQRFARPHFDQPFAADFAKLINHSGEVEEQSLSSWNVKGQYDSVVDAVKKAASAQADVKVFRVAHGSTRCEYYIVALNDQGVVVGVKARAVET